MSEPDSPSRRRTKYKIQIFMRWVYMIKKDSTTKESRIKSLGASEQFLNFSAWSDPSSEIFIIGSSFLMKL